MPRSRTFSRRSGASRRDASAWRTRVAVSSSVGGIRLQLEAVLGGEVVEQVLGAPGVDQVRGDQGVVGCVDAERLRVVHGERRVTLRL